MMSVPVFYSPVASPSPPSRSKVSAAVLPPMIAAVWARANRAARQAHVDGVEGSRLRGKVFFPHAHFESMFGRVVDRLI